MEGITLGQISNAVLFLGGFIGGIYLLFNYIKKWLLILLSNTFKDNNEATKCLLRSNITSKYYVYIELGEIPQYEKENINYMYEQYVRMGGNSYIKQIVEEINRLPVKQ